MFGDSKELAALAECGGTGNGQRDGDSEQWPSHPRSHPIPGEFA